MPLILLFAFPALVFVLIWGASVLGVGGEGDLTAVLAFFVAILICANLGQKWEARQASKRRYGPTS